MDKKEKINYIMQIYNRQHYFVDRHDAMAEKFINVLLVEVTALTIIFSIVIQSFGVSIKQYIILSIYIVLFSITLIKLFLVIRPLSKIAIDKNNELIIQKENKNWINNSLIYYQGIIARKNESLNNEKAPTEEYIKNITDDTIEKDLVQQIFILAQYSDFKRKKLEKTVFWTIITSIYGIIVAILLVVL